MGGFFRWLRRIFGGVSRILEKNKILARSAVRLSLGAFLENNRDYADEVARALSGLKELILEGRISTNEELKKELNELVSKKDVPLYLRYSIQDVIDAVFSVVDDQVNLSKSEYKDLWLDIIDSALGMANLYVESADRRQ